MRTLPLVLAACLMSGCYLAHDVDGRPVMGGGEGTVVIIVQGPLRAPGVDEFLFMQARRAETHPFDVGWMGGDVSGTQTAITAGSAHCLRVRGPSSADLHVRAKVCMDPLCLSLGDERSHELQLAIEAPIYPDRETVVFADFSGERPGLREVGRCDVEGCIEGVSTSFCNFEGVHFCEDNPQVARPMLTRCMPPIRDVQIN